MRKVLNYIILLGAIGFFIIILRPYLGHQNQEAPAGESNQDKPIQGSLAPSFNLTDGGGKKFQIGGEMEKAVYLDFWASWCEPCIKGAKDIQQVYEEMGDQIDFVTINATHYDKITNAKQFIADHQWTLPVLYDLDGEIAKQYRVSSYPISFLIDKQGKIKEIQYGIVEISELRRKLSKLALEP